MQLYTNVLASGWKFASQHSTLWLFGLFAVFVTGVAGEIDRYFRYLGDIVSTTSPLNPDFWTESAWYEIINNAVQQLAAGNLSMWLFVVSIVVSVAVVVYMVLVSQAALIYAAQNQSDVRFITLFTEGRKHVWQLLFLNLVTMLVLCTITFMLSASVLALADPVQASEARSLLVVIASLVLAPLVLIVSLISRYAAQYIVLRNQHLAQAIRSASKLFFANWLVSVEMALAVFVVAVVANLAIVLVSFVVVAPYAAATLSTVDLTYNTAALYNTAFVGGIFYIGVTILFAGLFSAWQWTSWTLLFDRLHKEKHTGKLVRVLARK